jgi:D-alanyl-D-alanine carboxypeptidase (penicillin-binding protein 5/6)
VAKAMTALVVLAAHPLARGMSGPEVTMTGADVVLYRQAVAQGGSNLRVHAGEILTERDLLLALLLPSADNIAETLAVWVSGNRASFIARLNATASAMGMTHTHFADPSGLSAATVSTAGDLVALARAVTANAALTELVGVRQAALPDGTVLNNLDILLGTQPGWLGIKTGWTGVAGGCLLFAASMVYAPGRAITVWGAVLGQPPLTAGDPQHPELGEAFVYGRSAAVAALRGYAAVDLAGLSPQLSGSISTRWGDSSLVLLAGHAADVVLVRSGALLRIRVTTLATHAPLPGGANVGEITGVLDAKTSITWKVVSASDIAGPSPWWKLFSS